MLVSPSGGRFAGSAMRTLLSHTSRRAALLGAVVFLLLVLAPAANAFPVTVDQPEPVVGETLTFTAGFNPECGNNQPPNITFKVDGTTQPTSTNKQLQTSFSTTGPHTVDADGACPDVGGSTGSGTLTVEIREFGGSIAVSPDPPYTNETLTLAATQTGGYGTPSPTPGTSMMTGSSTTAPLAPRRSSSPPTGPTRSRCGSPTTRRSRTRSRSHAR